MDNLNSNIIEKIYNSYISFPWYPGQRDIKNPEVHNIRNNAITRFKELGFPEMKDEDWRYTNPKDFYRGIPSGITPKGLSIPTKVKSSRDKNAFLTPDLSPAYAGMEMDNIVVNINGNFSEEFSSLKNIPRGVIVKDFKKAIEENPEIINTYFSKLANYKTESFTALNTAFANCGIFIYIPSNVIIDKPLALLHFSGSDNQDVLLQPRSLIIVENNSTLSIVESRYSLNNFNSNTINKKNIVFTNHVSEIYLKENSSLHHYKEHNENDNCLHLGNTYVKQEKFSKYKSFNICWGGKIQRSNINTVLGGEGCECYLKGLYLLDGNRHIDIRTVVDHAVPNCSSDELYKGIMAGESTGVFNGKIIVRKDAQKTVAYQSNKNLLLSDKAVINSKPQLEIFADDVKCSHGATTGRLDKDEVFYLRSRGISKKEAENLLTYAFASEIITDIDNSLLREYLEAELHKKITLSTLT